MTAIVEPARRGLDFKNLAKNPHAIALGIVLILYLIPHVARKNLDPWSDVYPPTAQRFINGQDIYPRDTPYVYPPFSMLLIVPLVGLPTRAIQGIWFVVSAAALVGLVRASWLLSNGGKLDRYDGEQRREHWILWLGCACALRFSFNAISHLSMDVIIGWLIMAGGLWAVQNRFNRTAVAWGLATAFKGPPLLLAGYLIWRGKIWPAILMVIVAVGVNLLPDLFHHPPEGGLWVTRWYRQYVQPLGRAEYTPGQWHADILDNQSVAGAMNRWFLTTYQPVKNDIVVVAKPDSIDRATLKKIVYGIDLLICVLCALAIRPGRFPAASEIDDKYSHQAALEIGVAVLLMLLLAPMSSRSLFCTMLLPALCVARAAVQGRDRVALACLVLAIVCSVISFNTFSALKVFNQIMHWLGVVSVASLLLLIGSLWVLHGTRRLRDRVVRSSDTSSNAVALPS